MEQSINNIRIFTSGSNNNKSIVLVHGFPYDHTMWEKTVDGLKDNYFCISYDIRGLGKSPEGSGQLTIESFVDDLEMIIGELKLNKPVLCGLSMGGYISLRAVERMKDKFSAVVLCDTKSEADDNAAKLKRAAAVKYINENGAEPFIREFVRNCFGPVYLSEKKEEYQKLEDYYSTNNPAGVKGCLIAMAARTDTTAALNDINIPALLLCGEEDKLTPPEVMEKMHGRIASSEFVLIKNAGHMTPIENPQEFIAAVSEFLQKVSD